MALSGFINRSDEIFNTRTIGVVLNSNHNSGGGYIYERSVVSMLEGLKDAKLNLYVLDDSSDGLFDITENVKKYKLNFADRARIFVLSVFRYFPNFFTKSIFISSLEKQMIHDEVKIAYFLSPNPVASIFQTIPMINTVWDLGHRELIEFPELRSLQTYRNRENYLFEALPRSIHVFTDSLTTKQNLLDIYNVRPERISALGLFPSVELDKVSRKAKNKENLVIYPANLWPHKNHDLLFNAMAIVCREISCKLILTSADMSSNDGILNKLAEKHPEVNFEYKKGLKKIELEDLIRTSKVLVMPSSLGPTNLPPLEAILLGTRIVVSNAHSDPDLVNNPNTIVIDPYNSKEFADAIMSCIKKPDFVEHLDPTLDAQNLLVTTLLRYLERVR
jgi:glycosyltransferase involved in cell wall biosynthesis